MARKRGLSVRAKLTLSYAGFLTVAGAILLGAIWFFLIRTRSSLYIPSIDDFLRVFDPGSFGPVLFAPAAIVVLAILMLVGLIGGWLLAGRMLAPLTQVTDAARKVAGGSLSYRIELDGRADEIRELADTFDDMLDRVEARDIEQQRFAANASHELRTPLAITQTLLDVARNDPQRDSDELDERLRAVNARAIELTEALLLLSRADRRSFVPEDIDLSLIAEQATEDLHPLADKHGVVIGTSGDVARMVGSPALMQQLASNLVHNAIVHNSPDHGTVEVRTENRGHCAVLIVENSGEVVSPEMALTLAEPFQRGTGRIRSDHAGVGLGLAIAKSIAHAHEGTLTLCPRTNGGLRVVVELPVDRRSQ